MPIEKFATYLQHERNLIGEVGGKGAFGYISGHRSHRTGRDVDLALFAKTPTGRPVESLPMVAYDRFGIARRDDKTVTFDAAANWELDRK